MMYPKNETVDFPGEDEMKETEELTEEQQQDQLEAEDDLHEIQVDDDINEPDPEDDTMRSRLRQCLNR